VRSATLTAPRPGKRGLSLSFSLSQDATVRYEILRRVGSPAWSSCPRGTGTTPHTFTGVSQTSGQERAGQHQITLATTSAHRARGQLRLRRGHRRVALAWLAGRRELVPGTYLLRVTVANGNGRSPLPVRLKFWVLGPQR